MKKGIVIIFLCIGTGSLVIGQPDSWQQRARYSMDINMDVNTNRFSGKQKLEYTNNSPDTLKKVFYHLYWNAFQPNSIMDVRNREYWKMTNGNQLDWDPKIADRISKLKENEIGFQKIVALTINGSSQKFIVHETILEVQLSRPILPKSKVVIDMEFEAQVPLQIRRAGRDAPTNGVRYSMSQWYPKICEYDEQGWHPTPYIGREFYGVWGDFDVKISIDKSYILGGTGYLQNPNQVGYGYETAGTRVVRPSTAKLTWHFLAPNVHDFVWAADPNFKHLKTDIANGPTIHVLYRDPPNAPVNDSAWKEILDFSKKVWPFIEKQYGKYPYKQYSFIQGGDGGMEYPMATLIKDGDLGTASHELMHSWFQGLLANNESLYAWLDEGFSNFSQSFALDNYIRQLPKDHKTRKFYENKFEGLPYPVKGNYNLYFSLVRSGKEEPLSTHADHFDSYYASLAGAYYKGAVFIEQLAYIVGKETRDRILIEYYKQWRFKHPTANDFIAVAEKQSNMKLDWYQQYWINTTKTIDYGIDSLWEEGGKSKIRLKRIGKIPMPVDLVIQYKDGSKEIAYVPMYLMFGVKPVEDPGIPTTVFPAWKWTHPTYTVEVSRKLADMKTLEIDESQRMADIERRNNKLEIPW